MLALLLEKEEFHLKKYLTVNLTIMGKIKVTKVKSDIKRTSTQKRTLESLGLRKMNQSVVHDNTPSILGMVSKVQHLVSVEEMN